MSNFVKDSEKGQSYELKAQNKIIEHYNYTITEISTGKNPYYDLMKQICDEIHWFPKYGKHYTSTLEHYNQLLENNS